MAIALKYQGQEKSRSRNEESFKETYQGTEAEVDNYISNLPEISTSVEGKGHLTSWRKWNDARTNILCGSRIHDFI